MLIDMEMLAVEELQGKVAVIRTTPEGHHATMMEVNRFLAGRPDMQKAMSFMVLVGNGDMPILSAQDVAKAVVAAGVGIAPRQEPAKPGEESEGAQTGRKARNRAMASPPDVGGEGGEGG